MKEQSSALQSAEASRTIQPAFLYFIKHGATEICLTSYDKPITVDGGSAVFDDPQIFAPASIDHQPPEESSDATSQPTIVAMAANDTTLRGYFLTAPTRQIEIDIYRVNSADLPGPIEYADLYLEFKGVCQNVAFKGYQIEAGFLAPIQQEDRIVPRYFYQKTCNHTLGNQFCKINLENYKLVTTLDSVDRINKTVGIAATTITVDSPTRVIDISEETFQGGRLIDSAGNQIGIVACEERAAGGFLLWLNYWPGTLAVSGSVTLYMGCLKIVRVCDVVFENKENFGGMPYIPTTNPATNSIIT